MITKAIFHIVSGSGKSPASEQRIPKTINVTTAENSKATQTENAPAVNNTTSTEIQNNARDIGSQKNTNSSTLASQDANSKINQKNANSDTIELKVPTANKKVEMSEDIDAKTVALNLKDTKHELTNNMNTKNKVKVIALTMIVGGTLEYLCSYIQAKVFGTISWNYSNLWFNINGRTSLLHCTYWGIAGVLYAMYIKPMVERLRLIINKRNKKKC